MNDEDNEIVTPTLNNQEEMESNNSNMNELRDKRLTSIVAINLFCIGNTVQSILYKLLAAEGKITLLEYTLFRNLAILSIAFVLLRVKGLDPISILPK